jgi:hypothetical protein
MQDSVPTTRPGGCPFDPPGELDEIREQSPLTAMTYPDGHIGWQATSHATVCAVLAGSARRHGPARDTCCTRPPGRATPPDHGRSRIEGSAAGARVSPRGTSRTSCT